MADYQKVRYYTMFESSANGSGPTLDERLPTRLSELKAELQAGQQQLAQKQAELSQLQQAILRISGAIQVLEELSTEAESLNGHADLSNQ